MKLVLCTVLAVLAASSSAEKNEISFVSPTIGRVLLAAAENRILEDEALAIIECFQKVLSEGLPEHGIPSFNPLEIPELKLDLDSLGIPGGTGFLNFETLVLGGTMGFEVTHLKISPLIIGGFGANAQITLLFNHINLNSDYEADLAVGGIAVNGKGDVKLDVTNLQLEVVLIIRLEAPNPAERIYLESMKFLPSVENIHIEFTGLFNDPEQTQQVNDLLNSVLTNWVNEKGQDISDLIEEIIKNIINNAGAGEPGEPTEDPSIIEIILNACKEDPITTVTETPVITTTAKPINDCENPTSIPQKINCAVVAGIEGLQEILHQFDPLVTTEDLVIDLGAIGLGQGTWTLEKLGLSGFSYFVLGKVSTVLVVPGIGIGAMVTIPLSWDNIDLDILEHADIELLGMKITAENSRVLGLLRNFDLTLKFGIGYATPHEIDIRIIPKIAENDIKAIITGISVNGEDVSGILTNFINNDLAKFLEKHGEDIGDIISAILINILYPIINPDPPETPASENLVVAHLADMIKQVVTMSQ